MNSSATRRLTLPMQVDPAGLPSQAWLDAAPLEDLELELQRSIRMAAMTTGNPKWRAWAATLRPRGASADGWMRSYDDHAEAKLRRIHDAIAARW